MNADVLFDALSDRYRLVRELGSGGMATVFLAEDLKHHRPVAVKVLRSKLGSALGRERFPREIEIIAQLSHPHILPLHDSGDAAGFLYYVMPYVEGETLRQRLQREGTLPITEALRILREVVDALAFAHSRGVVHRDIKPENVMLSGRHAIVMDFGVAKAVSAAGGEQLTTVGIALGTPAYMAPEQATGETDVDHRADLYATGILAYEMLTGAPPFVKPTAQAVLSAHVLEKPAALTERRPGVLPQCEDAIMKCLAKDRADRWQTAEQLLPVLEALATPSGGVTPTTTRPIQAHEKRRRTMWPALAGVVIALAAAITGWMVLGSREDGGIHQIAVLPITDLSGGDGPFVAAIHDALITTLAQTGTAGVIPRSAVLRYQDAAEPTKQIAAALGADAIVEGTVFRDGNRVRLNMQMLEPHGMRHLWTRTYERDVSDVLGAQRDIASQMAADITAALATTTGSPPNSGQTRQ